MSERVVQRIPNLLPAIAVVLFVGWFYIVHVLLVIHPPVGLYIGLLAFAAAVETIWPPDKAWPKGLWLLVFGALLVAEITTLYEQRHDEEKTQQANKKTEDDRFAGLLKSQENDFATVLSQNKKQFDATLSQLNGVRAKAKETISFTTGGDTFPFSLTAMNPKPDGSYEFGFWLESQGRYPLYKISASVVRAYRSRSSPDQIVGSGGSVKRDEFDAGSGGILIASFPMPEKSPAYFVADMTARNGQWEEVVEARAFGSRHVLHWVVYGSTTLSPSGIYGPYKKMMDLADHDFPESERSKLTYPLQPKLLDVEPQREDGKR
jgi:hypothetical protein